MIASRCSVHKRTRIARSMKWHRLVLACGRVHEKVVQVLFALVVQDRDDGLEFAMLFADTARRDDVRAGTRSAEQAAGARELAHFGDGFGARDAGRVTHEVAV